MEKRQFPPDINFEVIQRIQVTLQLWETEISYSLIS